MFTHEGDATCQGARPYWSFILKMWKRGKNIDNGYEGLLIEYFLTFYFPHMFSYGLQLIIIYVPISNYITWTWKTQDNIFFHVIFWNDIEIINLNYHFTYIQNEPLEAIDFGMRNITLKLELNHIFHKEIKWNLSKLSNHLLILLASRALNVAF
jgi:hypothetical protein